MIWYLNFFSQINIQLALSDQKLNELNTENMSQHFSGYIIFTIIDQFLTEKFSKNLNEIF